MLIGVFKSNQKIVNAFVIILAVLFWIPAFFLDLESSSLLFTGAKWLNIITILLIAGQSIYLNFIVNEYKLVENNSHLTSLIFVLLNSCFLVFLNLNKVIIANTFILIAFQQLLRLYNSKNNFSASFNASFLIGIATWIYFPNIVFFGLLWITLSYTTTPKWRDFMVSLIGLSTPLIYFISYKFITGGLSEFNISDYLQHTFSIKWSDITLFNHVFISTLIAIIVFAFISLFSSIGKSVVKISKLLVIVLLMFGFGLTTLFFNQFDYLATFLTLTIPLAIIIANFFQNLKKRWVAELLFTGLLTSIFLGYFS